MNKATALINEKENKNHINNLQTKNFYSAAVPCSESKITMINNETDKNKNIFETNKYKEQVENYKFLAGSNYE